MNPPPDKDHTSEVQAYYGKVLQSSEDLKTNACCAVTVYPKNVQEALEQIHPEIKEKFYGCGLTIPKKLEGLSVLDLGSGSGRDSYIVSKLVGEKGRVIGVDVTSEQLAVAKKHVDYQTKKFGYEKPNMEFLEGNIEALDQIGLKDQSHDLIISNCVINLVNDKEAVLRQAYRILKEGGELFFSDIYSNRRIPTRLVNDPVLYGECLSGALYWNDFLSLAKKAGFTDPRWVEGRKLTIDNQEAQEKLKGYDFYSVTCRLIKNKGLEPDCEDYGHSVKYLGGVEDEEDEFVLDSGHRFPKGKTEKVCGNSYLMVKDSRFAKHFEFSGDFSTHYGVFPGCGGHFPFEKASQGNGESCC